MPRRHRWIRAALNHARFSVLRPAWWLEQRARRALFRSLIAPDALCFDIGANVGQSAALYLELGARVVAVEPQSRCLPLLRERLDEQRWQGRWTVLAKAVGSESTEAEMRGVRNESQVASLSSDWIEAVQASGRFSKLRWTERAMVPVTTLDALIAEHGVPDFCKIDVEGWEPEVLAGLSQPLPLLSFEFTAELSGHLRACLDELRRIGRHEFQFARHQRWRFEWSQWCSAEELFARLRDETGGDVYARLVPFAVKATRSPCADVKEG